MNNILFADREDAGKQLAAKLLRFKDKDPVVLALPRGGIPIGLEVSAALNAPLDLILVRKIGTPGQPELAVGAVVDGPRPELVINRDVKRLAGIPDDYIEREKQRQLREIERRRKLWLGERARVPIKGKTALVVDDGIATGATVRAALHAVRRSKPARLILAAPVAPPETVNSLRGDADEIVCLAMPDRFWAISMFYGRFPQIADDEVTMLMKRAADQAPAHRVAASGSK